MKHFVFFVLALCIGQEILAQPVTNDTVVCIIDTTKSYVQYRENVVEREIPTPFHWQIAIDGHYYDHRPYDKDFASTVFEAGLWMGVSGVEEGFPKKRVPKKGLKKRYIVEDEEWITNQTSVQTLGTRLGFFPADKYNYIIFSQDYYSTESDSVTMHRVEIGFNEVVY